MASKAGKDALKMFSSFKNMANRFRVGSEYRDYLHPHKSPESAVAPQIPTSNPETEFNIAFYKRQQLDLTPAEGEVAEEILPRGDFPHHLPRPAWTGDDALMEKAISQARATGLYSFGVANASKDEDFISAKEIYGDAIVGEDILDYFDTTKTYLKGRVRAEENRLQDVRTG